MASMPSYFFPINAMIRDFSLFLKVFSTNFAFAICERGNFDKSEILQDRCRRRASPSNSSAIHAMIMNFPLFLKILTLILLLLHARDDNFEKSEILRPPRSRLEQR